MEEPVMYIVVRADLKLPKGKVAAQAGHAVQLAVRSVERLAEPRSLQHLADWESGSYVKIALGCHGEAELRALADRLTASGVTCAPVVDEGRTVIPAGTLTALGIQPLPRSKIAPLVAHLRLL